MTTRSSQAAIASVVSPDHRTLDEILRNERLLEQRIAELSSLLEQKQHLYDRMHAERNAYVWQRDIILRVARKTWASASWTRTAPFRRLQRLFSPTVLTEKDLLSSTDIEQLAFLRWRTQREFPALLLPCRPLHGWVRIRLRMWTDAATSAYLFFDTGNLFTQHEFIELGSVYGDVERDFFLQLPSPVHCFRLDPIRAPGTFEIKSFRIEPLAGLAVDLNAYRRADPPTRKKAIGRLLKGKISLARGILRPALLTPPADPNDDYATWRRFNLPTEADLTAQRAWANSLSLPPTFSILVPTYNTPPDYLRECLDSVLAQSYPHWQLCLADDASPNPEVRTILEEYSRKDLRISVCFCPKNGGISATSNAALDLAAGEYIALLDHDDTLEPHALDAFARRIVKDPQLDWLYSDEDKLRADGVLIEPFFKPDFSPEFLLGCMYTSHLSLYRTSAIRELGGFRSEYDGSQDHDLALRMLARTPANRVAHIADILYHWRIHPTSTAAGISVKPQAWDAGQRAVMDYLRQIDVPGSVERGPSDGLHRVRFALRSRPLITIVIPSACCLLPDNTYWAEKCVRSIRDRSSYRHIEIIVVGPPTIPEPLSATLDSLGVRRIAYDLPFNFSQACNAGAAAGAGEHLLFLNDDCEVVSPDWIEELLSFSQLLEMSAVGARLNYPFGAIQHVGVAILDGQPMHPFHRFPADESGHFFSNRLPRNWSAVTAACLMTRRDVFETAGRFDTNFPLNYNDVDLCLRIRQAGYRILCSPYAQLIHHESVTQSGLLPHELPRFQAHWQPHIALDPYYNPNLTVHHADFRIAIDNPPTVRNAR